LPSKVQLTPGDDFYVYLHITDGGSFPQAFDYRYPGYTSNSTASPGESYYSFNGSTWTDINAWNNTANFSIKAFTQFLRKMPMNKMMIRGMPLTLPAITNNG
jgi:hypothetical protein